jgi:hypothetical protein
MLTVTLAGGVVLPMLPPPPQAAKDKSATTVDASRNDFITVRTPVCQPGIFLGRNPVRAKSLTSSGLQNVVANIHAFDSRRKGETTCNYHV